MPCKFVIVSSSAQISPRLNNTWLSDLSEACMAETEARVHFGDPGEVPAPASAKAQTDPGVGVDEPL